MLAALGAHSSTGPLDAGGAALKGIAHVNLLPAIDAVQGVELIAATDVDNPLLGIRGASATYGPQKGADQAMVVALDAALEHFAAACGRTAAGKDPAVALGSGAAGGLGYGLMRIGARREPGIATVLDAVGLVPCLREADLVITGEGKLDDQSLHGKVVIGVAQAAASVGCACIAVAGQVRLGKRELGGAGIDAAYSVSDFVGLDFSMSEPHEAVAQATARVARTWGRR
jgi:glycerate kinase